MRVISGFFDIFPRPSASFALRRILRFFVPGCGLITQSNRHTGAAVPSYAASGFHLVHSLTGTNKENLPECRLQPPYVPAGRARRRSRPDGGEPIPPADVRPRRRRRRSGQPRRRRQHDARGDGETLRLRDGGTENRSAFSQAGVSRTRRRKGRNEKGQGKRPQGLFLVLYARRF